MDHLSLQQDVKNCGSQLKKAQTPGIAHGDGQWAKENNIDETQILPVCKLFDTSIDLPDAFSFHPYQQANREVTAENAWNAPR